MLNVISAVKEKLGGNSHEPDESVDWLGKALGIYGDALPEIRDTVDKMMDTRDPGRGEARTVDEMQRLSRRVSDSLIRQAAFKTGAIGGITAAPVAIPVIGALGTAAIGISADFTYLIRKQVWLCYGISAAYDIRMEEEELKAVILALLGFSGSGQLSKEIATRAVKEMVNATASRFLRKGIVWSASEVAAVLTPRMVGRGYKLIPFLGMPLSASVNIASTIAVGNHARRYFGSEGKGVKTNE